jgi:hypothetical protein
MNKTKIAEFYQISADKVNKLLNAAGLEHNAEQFSPQDMQLFDVAYQMHAENNMSMTAIRKEMDKLKQQVTTSSHVSATIPPGIMAIIDQQAEVLAKQVSEEIPDVFKQQKELFLDLLVQRFWKKMAEIAESGQLQGYFRQFLCDNGAVIEAAVLPGESHALPENSSSAT